MSPRSARISPGLASGNDSVPVSAASPQPRSGSGSVAKLPDQALYDHGTVVQLTATPAVGWHFVPVGVTASV